MSPRRILEAVEPIILGSIGAFFEGEVFSVLKKSPYAVRSFEFALADGAIDCCTEYEVSTSYAGRFWNVDGRACEPELSSELALIDVKAASGDEPFFSGLDQRKRVAAYICVGTANPAFVDVNIFALLLSL